MEAQSSELRRKFIKSAWLVWFDEERGGGRRKDFFSCNIKSALLVGSACQLTRFGYTCKWCVGKKRKGFFYNLFAETRDFNACHQTMSLFSFLLRRIRVMKSIPAKSPSYYFTQPMLLAHS